MKKILALVLVAALALCGYVAAGPFLVMRSVSAAVQRGDMRALERDVDFPRVRAGIRAQLEDHLARRLPAGGADGVLAALGREAAAGIAGGAVDLLATPAGIGAVLQGRNVVRRAMGLPPDAATAPDTGFDPLRDAEWRYESPSRFTATVRNADGAPVVFVFTRDGLRWRITDVRLPLDELLRGLIG